MQKYAKGSEQRIWADILENGMHLYHPSYYLRGRARQYLGKYNQSFSHFMDRLKAAGYEIIKTPGPRGGEYSATYTVKGSSNG